MPVQSAASWSSRPRGPESRKLGEIIPDRGGEWKGGKAYPDPRIVLLLVWLVIALGIADLCLKILDIRRDIIPHAAEVSPLQIRVEVDLDDTAPNGLLELFDGRAGTAVEDEEGRLVILALELFLEVDLVLAETIIGGIVRKRARKAVQGGDVVREISHSSG